MNAQRALQAQIEAQQQHDAIEYGLRSIQTCRGEHGCIGVHAGQLIAAKIAAAELLGREAWQTVDAFWLRHAKQRAREELKAAKAAVKQIGGIRQLRLALAETDTHEYALVA